MPRFANAGALPRVAAAGAEHVQASAVLLHDARKEFLHVEPAVAVGVEEAEEGSSLGLGGKRGRARGGGLRARGVAADGHAELLVGWDQVQGAPAGLGRADPEIAEGLLERGRQQTVSPHAKLLSELTEHVRVPTATAGAASHDEGRRCGVGEANGRERCRNRDCAGGCPEAGAAGRGAARHTADLVLCSILRRRRRISCRGGRPLFPLPLALLRARTLRLAALGRVTKGAPSAREPRGLQCTPPKPPVGGVTETMAMLSARRSKDG